MLKCFMVMISRRGCCYDTRVKWNGMLHCTAYNRQHTHSLLSLNPPTVQWTSSASVNLHQRVKHFLQKSVPSVPWFDKNKLLFKGSILLDTFLDTRDPRSVLTAPWCRSRAARSPTLTSRSPAASPGPRCPTPRPRSGTQADRRRARTESRAWKNSIRRLVITEKAPTRAY